MECISIYSSLELEIEALRYVRDRFHLPLSDDQVSNLQFYSPPADSPEIRYLRGRRHMLGGTLPARSDGGGRSSVPPLEGYTRSVPKAGWQGYVHDYGGHTHPQRATQGQGTRTSNCPHRRGRGPNFRDGTLISSDWNLRPAGPAL